MLQYLPHLARRGFRVEALPLLPDAYVEDLYAGRPVNRRAVARAYLHRARALLDRHDDAVLWIEKELFPWLPAFVEAPFLKRGRRIVVDCDDAVWLRYRDLRNGSARALLGRKIEHGFARAHVVMAGNRWIADHARAAGAADVRVLPSVVDPDRYAPRAGPREAGPWRIGWIGSPATVHYLRALGTVLQALAARQTFELVCVGGGMVPLQGVRTEARAWDADTEAAEIGRFDIGVMPLADGEWERGKCGYKIIQYMACGVPVVASRVGANVDIVRDGEDGLLAGGNAEWVAALERLLQDPALAARLGAAGRRKVEASYSVQARCDELAAALGGGD
jgi:glycosyltransferase involved in cell wall biosynthesis